MAANPPVILVTAFEPSGDAHAAELIRRLRADSAPDARIVGLGGPKMAAAGCELLETTAEDAAMGLDALGRIRWLKQIVERMRGRLDRGEVAPAIHVPVDSPAANFPICRLTKPRGSKVVHLVAPQMWAWGPWRVRKLRRLTDGVLCLLPFEPAWFAARGVPATFIGHPRLARAIDARAVRVEAARLGVPGTADDDSRRRLVLLPGSRGGEVTRNADLLARLARELVDRAKARGESVAATCAPTTAEVGDRIVRAGAEHGVHVDAYPGGLDPVVHGADLVLSVSGTVTLDVTRLGAPMVGVFRTTAFSNAIADVLLTARHRLLPNLVAGDDVVPEFVPWAGSDEPIIAAADRLLADPAAADRQRAALAEVIRVGAGADPAGDAAEAVAAVLRDEPFPGAVSV